MINHELHPLKSAHIILPEASKLQQLRVISVEDDPLQLLLKQLMAQCFAGLVVAIVAELLAFFMGYSRLWAILGSALLGCTVAMLGQLTFTLVGRTHKTTVAHVLHQLLRAEAAKITVIILLLGLAHYYCSGLVPVVFTAAFACSILACSLSGLSPFVFSSISSLRLWAKRVLFGVSLTSSQSTLR